MKLRVLFVWVILGMFWAVEPAYAQENYQQMRSEILQKQDSTRSEIEQLNTLIDQYQQRLTTTEKKYDKIYKQYQDLARLLALQEKKIKTLQKEQNQINSEITVTKKKRAAEQKKLEDLIENYKKTMRYVYKHGQTSQLALVLSSASINQMIVRNYYLKKFETFREKQAQDIKNTQAQLKQSEQDLDKAAEKNKGVLAEINQEKEKQQQKTKQQQNNVALLRKDRKRIQSKLNHVQQQKATLNSTLTKLITRENEVRKAEQERLRRQEAQRKNNLANAKNIPDVKVREREVAKYKAPVRREGFLSDKELSTIEKSFSAAKGTLPWPVETHTVSEHFGRRRNPVYGTVTPNLGIEIVTKPDAPVHVVHEGYVFAVQPVAGYGDVVFVSHGKFITAYGNLSRVMVHKNTILKKNDVVGLSGDQNSIRGASVFFMLREGSSNIDPEKWLK